MSNHSDRPGLSSAFNVGRSPDSMAAGIRDLARAAEYARRTDQNHWRKIVELESAVQRLSEQNEKITITLSVLKTKFAIYVAIGSGIVGLIVSVLLHYLRK